MKKILSFNSYYKILNNKRKYQDNTKTNIDKIKLIEKLSVKTAYKRRGKKNE